MTMTSTTAQAHLDAWLAADLAVTRNQSYSISDGATSRSLNRTDGELIASRIAYWQRKVSQLLAQEAGRTNPGYKIAKLRSPAS